MLETNDKQHLSISILLNDNQQLQDKLLAREAELHLANQETLAALTACKAAEQSLTASQVLLQVMQMSAQHITLEKSAACTATLCHAATVLITGNCQY